MALVRQNGSVPLQSAATTTATGPWVKCYGPAQTYQAVANGTAGAFSATVVIEVSNDGATAVGTPLGSISVSGTATAAASDGFTTAYAPWAWVRARVTAISGTGANVSTWMGC
jgi:hypothetical protein